MIVEENLNGWNNNLIKTDDVIYVRASWLEVFALGQSSQQICLYSTKDIRCLGQGGGISQQPR